MSGAARIRRLRWMCRRGMKELDVLLEAFLAANAPALDTGEWPELERLLAFEDDALWDCLREPGRSPASAYDGLIDAIRNARGQNA